jgi:hypothetical protein
VGQQANPLDAQLLQVASNYLQDPDLGKDYGAYQQNQLEQFDRRRSAAQEAVRQQLGDTSQSGELRSEFLKNILDTQADRATLESDLNEQEMTERQTNLMNALTGGRETSSTIGANEATRIANLVSMLGAGEGTEERTFEAAQADIERAWKTGERVSAEDFEKNMAYLNSELATAKANNDTENTIRIMGIQARYTLERDAQQFGYETALQNNQGEIDKALREGDFEHALALQSSQQEFQAYENAQNRELQRVELLLEQHGVDMAQVKALFESGAIDGDTYRSFVQGTITTLNKTLGSDEQITFNAPDPDAIQKAMDDAFNDMKYQYGLSHPDMVNADGSLTAEGLKQFYDFYNQSTYGLDSNNEPIESWAPDSMTFGNLASTTGTPSLATIDKNGDLLLSTNWSDPSQRVHFTDGQKVNFQSQISVKDLGYIPPGNYTTMVVMVEGLNIPQEFVVSEDGSTIYPIHIGNKYNDLKTARKLTPNGYVWDEATKSYKKGE